MTGRPPKGRTWGRRGITPRVKVSGRSRGRLSVAGLLCFRPGLPARLCYRLRRHTGRKGERRSLGEADYIRLLDGAHQLLKAPLIVVWDRLNTHISKRTAGSSCSTRTPPLPSPADRHGCGGRLSDGSDHGGVPELKRVVEGCAQAGPGPAPGLL
ncbi:hypothetical protein ABT218_28230 [Streptomyces sp. NPDC001455]|uniref:hypothetical protein n=1 Tax=unclassified Streptomyces TaxID=2593676 RepID=UPI0033256F78